MKLESIYTLSKTIFFVSLTAICFAITFGILPVIKRIEIASAQLLDCTITENGKVRGNAACLQSQLLAITGSTRATMGAIAKSAPEITQSIRAASVNSVAASQASTETAKSANKLLLLSQDSVSELNSALHELHDSIVDLTAGARMVLTSSNDVMRNLSLLEVTLNKQVEQQSPEIGKTLQAMQALLNDPSLKSTFVHIDGIAANTEKGTEHLAQTAETIDIATRDLRKKAGRVKWVIEKLLGLVKLTIPL